MVKSLPPNPSVRQLKIQAKDLLKAHRNGVEAVCETLRLLRRFSGSSPGDVLGSTISLKEAQFAVALSYGFRGWKQLMEEVQATDDDRTAAKSTDVREILIVDDEPMILDVLVKFVRELLPELSVYPIVTAEDGAEALHHINRQTPLLLILNVHMPGKSGGDVLRELSGRDERFPILVTSGWWDSKELALESGEIPEDSFEYLQKPFKATTFVEAVRKMLSSYPAQQRGRRGTAAATRTRQASPKAPPVPNHQLIILYAWVNRMKEAQAEATNLLKHDPDFTVEGWGKDYARYRGREVAERDMALLRKAGLR